MELHYRSGETTHTVRVKREGDGRYRVEVLGMPPREIVLRRADGGALDLLVDGKPLRAYTAAEGERRLVQLSGKDPVALERIDKKKRRAGPAAGGDDQLTASMTGQVVAVLVKPGDLVERGAPLVVLEAMKMEMRVTAPHAGRVKAVSVKAGEVVERGRVLVEVEPLATQA